MTLEELEEQLPNGLHDSRLLGLEVNVQSAWMRLSLAVADDGCSDGPRGGARRNRPLQVLLTGLRWISIPSLAGFSDSPEGLWIDSGSGFGSDGLRSSAPRLEGGEFAHWLFLVEHDAFIQILASDARILA